MPTKLGEVLKPSLGNKLALYVFAFSIVSALASTAIDVCITYSKDIAQLNMSLDFINKSYVPSISAGVWNFDTVDIQSTIHGIFTNPAVRYVRITNTTGSEVLTQGVLPDANTIAGTFPLIVGSELSKGVEPYVGNLLVVLTKDYITENIWARTWDILLIQLAKASLLAIFVLLIFYSSVGRHLKDISQYFRVTDLKTSTTIIKLQRRSSYFNNNDELARMVLAINDLHSTLLSNIESLEYRVLERTKDLERTTDDTKTMLTELRQTQDKLIQSEKLASLGSIVAAVSHELNTPIGNCLILASTLNDHAKDMLRDIELNKLSKSGLTGFSTDVVSGSDILIHNLRRASNLIDNFKKVAVNQSSSKKQLFNLKEAIDAEVTLLHLMLKKTKYSLVLNVPEDIMMDSFPGAIEQVVSNLVNNSVIHGFEGREKGTITLSAVADDVGVVTIIYTDNGKGMSEETRKRVFDPFFTTKLGKGGSGLGMSICYNLVTGLLNGAITLDSVEDNGCTFTIILPLNI